MAFKIFDLKKDKEEEVEESKPDELAKIIEEQEETLEEVKLEEVEEKEEEKPKEKKGVVEKKFDNIYIKLKDYAKLLNDLKVAETKVNILKKEIAQLSKVIKEEYDQVTSLAKSLENLYRDIQDLKEVLEKGSE